MEKKTIKVIIGAMILILAIFLIVMIVNKSKENYTKLTDKDFLTTIKEWQNENSPNNVWKFNEDGTCTVTTDGKESYECTWTLNKTELKTVTKWLYDVTDTFNIKFDKEKVNYTEYDKSSGTRITYNDESKKIIEQKVNFNNNKVSSVENYENGKIKDKVSFGTETEQTGNNVVNSSVHEKEYRYYEKYDKYGKTIEKSKSETAGLSTIFRYINK